MFKNVKQCLNPQFLVVFTIFWGITTLHTAATCTEVHQMIHMHGRAATK